jgi:hypothetical protein
MADLVTQQSLVNFFGATPESVLGNIADALAEKGVPATAEAIAQMVATNDPRFARAVASVGTDAGIVLWNSDSAVMAMHGLGDDAASMTANISTLANAIISLTVQGVGNATGKTYTSTDNSKWIPANAWAVGHLQVATAVTEHTTSQVNVPAVYKDYSYTVPTSTDVTNYRSVTDVSYRAENASSVANSMIPFMRAVSLCYKGLGFKPESNYFAYFDGIDVTSTITPAQELTISSVVGQSFVFDELTDIGGQSDAQRIIPNNPLNPLKTGDIITGLTSNATGVLVGIELAPSNTLKLFVVNVKGTFSSTEIVVGSISTARGTIASIKIPTSPVSSTYGRLYGLYNLPNNPNLKFEVGTKTLLFSTGLSTDTAADSFGNLKYTANGVLHTIQPVVTTIRVETQRQEAYTTTAIGSQTISGTTLVSAATTTTVSGSQVVANFNQLCPLDPLAQSFRVEEETGVYITGIDLFFATKDTTLPVYVSIINVVNGYPGQNEVTESRTTIDAYDVNISTALSTTKDGKKWASPNAPTRVTFKAPIFLGGKSEYCIFIKSDSFKYNLWSSYLGDETVNGVGMTATQPIMGSLFKSQNANTWTTDQNQDLCFNLYRAKFDTSVISNIELKSEPLVPKIGTYTPIYVKTGSLILRVMSLGHGFQNGHTVAIANMTPSSTVTAGSFVVGVRYVISSLGATSQAQWNTAAGTSGQTYVVGSPFLASTVGAGTGTAIWANFFGYTSNQINGSHVVSNVEPDYYTISMPYVATSTGTLVDSNVTFSRNITIDNISARFQTIRPLNTDMTFTYAGTNKAAVKSLAHTPIINYGTVDTAETLLILSPENKSALLSSGVESLTMNVTLSSSNDFVSPMIDTHRMVAVTTGYKINNPTNTLNVVGLDYDTIASSSALITVDYANDKFATTNSALKLIFKTVRAGQYITVTGCSNSVNNGTFLVISVASDGADITVSQNLLVDASVAISIVAGSRFIDETAPGGSSAVAKYVSKPLTFGNISTAFKLYFDYNLPSGCGIDFYYKTSSVNDSSIHATLPYTKLSYTDNLIISSSTSMSSGAVFLQGLPNFDTLSLKIVYTSSNAHLFPRMRDFRIVALA